MPETHETPGDRLVIVWAQEECSQVFRAQELSRHSHCFYLVENFVFVIAQLALKKVELWLRGRWWGSYRVGENCTARWIAQTIAARQQTL